MQMNFLQEPMDHDNCYSKVVNSIDWYLTKGNTVHAYARRWV